MDVQKVRRRHLDGEVLSVGRDDMADATMCVRRLSAAQHHKVAHGRASRVCTRAPGALDASGRDGASPCWKKRQRSVQKEDALPNVVW